MVFSCVLKFVRRDEHGSVNLIQCTFCSLFFFAGWFGGGELEMCAFSRVIAFYSQSCELTPSPSFLFRSISSKRRTSSAIRPSIIANESRVKGRNKQRSSSDIELKSSIIV